MDSEREGERRSLVVNRRDGSAPSPPPPPSSLSAEAAAAATSPRYREYNGGRAVGGAAASRASGRLYGSTDAAAENRGRPERPPSTLGYGAREIGADGVDDPSAISGSYEKEEEDEDDDEDDDEDEDEDDDDEYGDTDDDEGEEQGSEFAADDEEEEEEENPDSIWDGALLRALISPILCLWRTTRDAYALVANVDDNAFEWDSPAFPGEGSCVDGSGGPAYIGRGAGAGSTSGGGVTLRHKAGVLFWLGVLAISYAAERSSFKVLVDRAGPFRLFSAEAIVTCHAAALGLWMLAGAAVRGDFKLKALGLPLTDVGSEFLQNQCLSGFFSTAAMAIPSSLPSVVPFGMPPSLYSSDMYFLCLLPLTSCSESRNRLYIDADQSWPYSTRSTCSWE